MTDANSLSDRVTRPEHVSSLKPTIIVACTRNFAIGRGGDLLFHISDDLKRFKALTMGHPIIMGRKTFESFPKGALPGRRNIVVTRNPAYTASGVETAASLEDAIALCDPSEECIMNSAPWICFCKNRRRRKRPVLRGKFREISIGICRSGIY